MAGRRVSLRSQRTRIRRHGGVGGSGVRPADSDSLALACYIYPPCCFPPSLGDTHFGRRSLGVHHPTLPLTVSMRVHGSSSHRASLEITLRLLFGLLLLCMPLLPPRSLTLSSLSCSLYDLYNNTKKNLLFHKTRRDCVHSIPLKNLFTSCTHFTKIHQLGRIVSLVLDLIEKSIV